MFSFAVVVVAFNHSFVSQFEFYCYVYLTQSPREFVTKDSNKLLSHQVIWNGLCESMVCGIRHMKNFNYSSFIYQAGTNLVFRLWLTALRVPFFGAINNPITPQQFWICLPEFSWTNLMTRQNFLLMRSSTIRYFIVLFGKVI